MANQHDARRADKELSDILNRNSVFDVLAALARVIRNRGYGPVADKLQRIYDELVPKVPPE